MLKHVAVVCLGLVMLALASPAPAAFELLSEDFEGSGDLATKGWTYRGEGGRITLGGSTIPGGVGASGTSSGPFPIYVKSFPQHDLAADEFFRIRAVVNVPAGVNQIGIRNWGLGPSDSQQWIQLYNANENKVFAWVLGVTGVNKHAPVSTPGMELAMESDATSVRFLHRAPGADAWIQYDEFPALGWTSMDGAVIVGDRTASIDSLVVEVIPEPATLGLLALGGLAALRRRR